MFAVLLGGCHIVFGLQERHDAAVAQDAPPDAPFDPAGCPETYEQVSTLPTRYRFELINERFSTQDSRCRLDSPAGVTHLALIETPAEAFALDEHLDVFAGNNYFWVGLTQATDAGSHDAQWTWLSGRPVDPVLWDQGEPNDGDDGVESNQENAAMFSRFGTGMALIDAPAIDGHYAICECDGVTLVK
jgi:hypothetical protein